jgi:hypothetical protein
MSFMLLTFYINTSTENTNRNDFQNISRLFKFVRDEDEINLSEKFSGL